MTGAAVLKILLAAVALLGADRLLLHMERRGWIYYRNSKAGRGAIGYHMLEMSSAFDPSHKAVQEIQVLERKQVDDTGDPLGSRPDTDDDRRNSPDDPDRPGALS